jgi:hypothetical protein
MIIQVDADGRKAVQALCDTALKVGGLTNFQFVAIVMGNTNDLPVLIPSIKPEKNLPLPESSIDLKDEGNY